MSNDWRERIVDQVTERSHNVKTVGLFFPPRWYQLVRDAARMRGMSTSAYVRRAAMAFVCHDLGLEYREIMAEEPKLRPVMSFNPSDDTPHAGGGFGAWKIMGLRRD